MERSSVSWREPPPPPQRLCGWSTAATARRACTSAQCDADDPARCGMRWRCGAARVPPRATARRCVGPAASRRSVGRRRLGRRPAAGFGSQGLAKGLSPARLGGRMPHPAARRKYWFHEISFASAKLCSSARSAASAPAGGHPPRIIKPLCIGTDDRIALCPLCPLLQRCLARL